MADLTAIEWKAPSAELDRALHLADQPDAAPADLQAALRLLRTEVLFRWQQRTALSFRLQDLRAALAQAGIDDQSTLYQRLHDVTATAEAWMHPGTLSEAVQAHIGALRALQARAPTEDMRIACFDSAVWDTVVDAMDLAPGPDFHVETHLLDGQVQVTAVRTGSPGRSR
ncbi:hypothetical protein [Stenotrophomonas acidaminiphila]|uniref:hypothetical protein n=1 Tax=Stenotrophomonas acidaminiphila TaxID=128780 RepID=UPI0024AD3F87|nr:hypothetical protein [Stenotrophomonas acidaminiphila]WHL17609.1 hypothetical protein QLF99_11055 [Stenotrophomonas acidaminiphila]